MEPILTLTLSVGLGSLALGALARMRAKRKRSALQAARRAKYAHNFSSQRQRIQNVRGRQFEDLDETEIGEYNNRDLARNQNIQFLRLLVADLFDEDDVAPDAEERQREELLSERTSWIEEHQEGLNEHAALVQEEEIGSGVSIIESTALEDDDIEERLEREGGKSGEVQLSLAWDDYNDLDLHVFCPSGERIYFNNKKSECGGELDVDMNVRPVSNNPVENVVWTGEAPPGKYKIGVHFYKHHRKRRSKKTTNFRLRVMVHGESRDYAGTITIGNAMQMVTTFMLKENVPLSDKSNPL